MKLFIIFVMSNETTYRRIFFYKRYYLDFFESQPKKVRDKIIWTIDLVATIIRVPEQYLKHIEGTDQLYEIRVQHGGNSFRIFCFFDKEKLVILMNGFQKKSEKIPKKEIEKAIKIKSEYEAEKKEQGNKSGVT